VASLSGVGRVVGAECESVVERTASSCGFARLIESSASLCNTQMGGFVKENDDGKSGCGSGDVGHNSVGTDVNSDGSVRTNDECQHKLRGNICRDGRSSPLVQRGPNWERNQEWKKNNRAKKARKHSRMRQNWRQDPKTSKLGSSSTGSSNVSFSGVSEVVSEVLSCDCGNKHVSTLRSSLEKKWEVENELAAERARRQLEVLKANDVDQEVKRYRTKVSAATEKNMVSIERTHAMLSATGNVPGAFHGSAETVVSGEPGLTDGSISPNSSASMAEFRACQKNLLDAQSENADLKRKMQLMSERFGFPMQHADYIDKRTWTDNEENDLILGDMYPDGYGMNTMFMPEGKFRPC